MSAVLKRPPTRMTVAEFREWDPGDGAGRRWQLVDGEPAAMAPAGQNHGAIQSELGYLLVAHLRDCGSTCRVITEPGIVPRVGAAENWRIPDLGVTCAPAEATVEVPDPVLLVEIISPGNYAETRANVWTYTTIPSVREVLVVHSTRIEAELYCRLADGAWPARPELLRGDDVLALASVGLSLPVRALYRTTSLAT